MSTHAYEFFHVLDYVKPMTHWFLGSLHKHSIDNQKSAAPHLSVIQSIYEDPAVKYRRDFIEQVASLHFYLRQDRHDVSVDLQVCLEVFTDFCQQTTQALTSMSLMGYGEKIVCAQGIQDFLDHVLMRPVLIKNFMPAFLATSYQRPSGYEICLALLGGQSNHSSARTNFIAYTGMHALRSLALVSPGSYSVTQMAQVVVALVRCCWSLGR